MVVRGKMHNAIFDKSVPLFALLELNLHIKVKIRHHLFIVYLGKYIGC